MNGRRWTRVLLKYGAAVFAAALMAFSVIELHGYALADTAAERYCILSNAFTIPGVILIMCWALVLVANEGAFEGISFAVTYAVKLLIPGVGNRQERYGDYVERRRAKGKTKGFGFLFYVGLVCLLAAVVFTVLFYRAG